MSAAASALERSSFEGEEATGATLDMVRTDQAPVLDSGGLERTGGRRTAARASAPSSGGDGKSDVGAELLGRVLLGDLRLARAEFSVHWIPAKGDCAENFDRRAHLRRTEKSGPSGQFHFAGLPVGESRLLVMLGSSSTPLAEAPVSLVPGRNSADLTIGPLDFSQYLLLGCLDPLGALTQVERVGYQATRGRGMFAGDAEVLPLADGRQLIVLPPEWGGVGTGETPWEKLLLTVSHPLYSDGSLWLRRGQREAVVQFMNPGDLHVRLEDIPGRLEGLVRIVVEPTSQGEMLRLDRGVRPDKGGIFRFSRVEPGENRVKVYVLDGRGTNPYKRNLVETHTVWVASGVQEWSVPFPALYDVAVRGPDGPAGTRIALRRETGDISGDFYRTMVLGRSGVLHFRDLLAGDYLIAFGSREIPISVPCGEVVLGE